MTSSFPLRPLFLEIGHHLQPVRNVVDPEEVVGRTDLEESVGKPVQLQGMAYILSVGGTTKKNPFKTS